MRSRWWFLVQAAVSAGLLILLANRLDLASFRDLFARVPLSFYLLSLGVVLAGQVAYAWRWRLLLHAAGVPVPFSEVVRQYFVGIFVNNFLPSTVGGDVAKVYYLGREHGFRVVTASVALDRLLGVGVLALLATAALSVSSVTAPRLLVAQMACAAIALAAGAIVIVTNIGTGGLPDRVRRFGSRAVSLAGHLQRLRLDMAAPLARPIVIVQSAVVVAGYALAIALLYGRFIDLQGLAVPPFAAVFAVVSATTVLSNVPISLNGLGLREQLHAALLAPLGVPAEVAVAVSLLLYGHLIVASLIGLALWRQAPSLPAPLASSL